MTNGFGRDEIGQEFNELVVEPTCLKNMIVKMGSSSPIFGVNINMFERAPPTFLIEPQKNIGFSHAFHTLPSTKACPPRSAHRCRRKGSISTSVARSAARSLRSRHLGGYFSPSSTGWWQEIQLFNPRVKLRWTHRFSPKSLKGGKFLDSRASVLGFQRLVFGSVFLVSGFHPFEKY